MYVLGHYDVERLQTVVRLAYQIAVRLQEYRNAFHDFAVVVHHQNSQLFHFPSPFRYFYLTTGFCCFPQGISLDFMKMKKSPSIEGLFLCCVLTC